MTPEPTELLSLNERFANVQRRIANAAKDCGRLAEEITLIAISKTHPAEVLREVLDLGVKNLGENKVREAEEKITELGRGAARWHMVGHLQTNKARRAVQLFDVIHSLDSAALAKKLDHLCAEQSREQLEVLIQVDLAGEKNKTGVAAVDLPELLKTIKTCSRLRLIGLMVLPPFFEDAECARPFFKALRDLRDKLRTQGHFGDSRGELSMGMTHDFEIAIQEGATMLRVGTAIFGERR